MFRPATGALIQADHIEPRSISLGGNSMHVVRIAAAFKPMYKDRGRRGISIRLPVATPQQLRARLDREQPIFSGNTRQQHASWPIPWDECHRMGIMENQGWFKRS
jgi:hypothetical protein